MKLSENKETQQALDLAEDSREADWVLPSFVGELFKGNFCFDLLHPYPAQSPDDKKIGDEYIEKLEACLKENINPQKVDEDQELPDSAVQALRDIGAFGMKIPKAYGGLGLSVTNYCRAMERVASWCGSTAVWLSAHQSIGAPQPLKIFGTKEQKEKFLPRLAKGAVSAFALTEADVGSDPAKMNMTATLSEDGQHYILNGEKLWCTNGTAAEIIIVMALTAPKIVDGREKKQVSAFIVETNTPGFEVLHRCRFMGIRAIANGLLRFKDVKVPKENLVGELGQGLKIALTTLNTGRLTIPMISAGVGKLCLHNCKKWANQRKQWGVKIGEHQAIGNLLADMAANTFAIESTSLVVASLADNEKADIRLEAAMAKYFGSESSWTMADNALQIRGGRGFEQEKSLKERGEDPFPIERILRDIRINRIIEGTSEIMRLFIAREAMDVHLKHIFPLLNPKKSNKEKLQAVGTMLKFYSKWYPTLYFPAQSSFDVKHLNSKNLAHLRYIAKTAKRLGRGLFHTMQRYQKKLEKEQVLLQQYVDIGTDLFAMACSLARAEHISALKPTDSSCQELVDLFCAQARDRIEACFKKVGTNHNNKMGQVSSHVLQGSFDWMCENVIK